MHGHAGGRHDGSHGSPESGGRETLDVSFDSEEHFGLWVAALRFLLCASPFMQKQLRAFALASTSSQSERSVVSMRMALTAILGAASGIALSQTLPLIVSSL